MFTFQAVESKDGIAMAGIAPDGLVLGWNIAGLVCIILWAGFWSTLMFGGLKMIGKLRIDRETEFKGNDQIKHGESAYPRDAWIEMQYSMKNEKQKGTSNDNAGDLPPHMQVSYVFSWGVTNRFFHEPNEHKMSKQSHQPSIMIWSTSLYEHHTSLYEHI